MQRFKYGSLAIRIYEEDSGKGDSFARLSEI